MEAPVYGVYGVYDALNDEYLQAALAQHPEVRSVLGKLDPEAESRWVIGGGPGFQHLLRRMLLRHCRGVVNKAPPPCATDQYAKRTALADRPLWYW